MENKKKVKYLHRRETIKQLKDLIASLEGGGGEGFGNPDGELTPKERCQIAHIGQCGECDDNGGWTGC